MRSILESSPLDLTASEYDDCYAAMRLEPASSKVELRKAFLCLAKELHPDRNPGIPDGPFKTMSYAYEMLEAYWVAHNRAPPSEILRIREKENRETLEARRRRQREEAERRRKEAERREQAERAEAYRRAMSPLEKARPRKTAMHDVFDAIGTYRNGWAFVACGFYGPLSLITFVVFATVHSAIEEARLSPWVHAEWTTAFQCAMAAVVAFEVYLLYLCPAASYGLYRQAVLRTQAKSACAADGFIPRATQAVAESVYFGKKWTVEPPARDLNDDSQIFKARFKYRSGLRLTGFGLDLDYFLKFKTDVDGVTTSYLQWVEPKASWFWWPFASHLVHRLETNIARTLGA